MRRDCSCRGSFGHAHLHCLVNYAKDKSYQIDETCIDTRMAKFRTTWKVCHNCKQLYRGQLRIDMANKFVKFADDAPKHHEPFWFSPEHEYNEFMLSLLALEEKQDALANVREAHDSEENRDAVRDIAVQMLVRVAKIKSDKSIMKIVEKHGMYLSRLEMMANTNLGDITPDHDKRKQKYYQRAANIMDDAMPSKSSASYELAQLVMKEALNIKLDRSSHYEDLRSAYERNIEQRIKEHGINDFRSMKFKLTLAFHMAMNGPAGASLQAERMLITLHNQAKLSLGEKHDFVKKIKVRLDFLRMRLVRIVSAEPGCDVKDYHQVQQAICYENDDMTHCVVGPTVFCGDIGPISFKGMGVPITQYMNRKYSEDMIKDFQSQQELLDLQGEHHSVQSKNLIYLSGTVVVCRKSALLSMELHDKIGVVTGYDHENKTYTVLFEDKDLGEKTMQSDAISILFRLDEHNSD